MIVRDERGRILAGSGGRPRGARNLVAKPRRREQDRRDFRDDGVSFLALMLKHAPEQVARVMIAISPVIAKIADDPMAYRIGVGESDDWPAKLRQGLRGMLEHLTMYPNALARALGRAPFDALGVTLMKEASSARGAIASPEAPIPYHPDQGIKQVPPAPQPDPPGTWRIDYSVLYERRVDRRRWSVLDGCLS